MRDLLAWNLNLGRWFGVEVRVHALFLLAALVVLAAAGAGPTDEIGWYTAFVVVLFASVLLHEFGHCFAAWRAGGIPRQIMLWPLGGLVHPNVPPEPLRECAVALAGPLVNLFLGLVGLLILLGNGAAMASALDPFAPPVEIGALTVLGVVRIAVWTNLWLLMALNLLPAVPMDGGRALKAVLWGAFGLRRASLAAGWAAQAVGVGLCLAAWFAPDDAAFIRLPIIALGVLLFFNARHEAARPDTADEFWPEGFDLSEADEGLFDEEFETVAAEAQELWDEEYRDEARRRRYEREREEDRRVDEILARLHQSGMDHLSPEDRALLARVSRRYRSRQQG